MILDQLISALVIIVGIAISFAYFPQAYRIWKNKSATDVSILSYTILAAGTTTYLLYGFYKNDAVLIAGFLFGVIGSWLVLLLALYYRRKGTGSSVPHDFDFNE